MSPVSRGRRKKASRPQSGRRRRRPPPAGAPTSGTAPARRRWRPTWHRYPGWILVAAGAYVVLANYIDYADLRLLPGGHNEGYLIIGLVVAGIGAYFLGLFDRP